MVFSSVVFLFLFFPLVLLCYFIAPGIKLKNAILILFSLAFYTYGEPKAVAIMLLSVLVNYALALIIEAVNKRNCKKAFIFITVVINLGMLFAFKYFAFGVEVFNSLFNTQVAVPKIELPIGISFFTFQVLSYVLDVYKGDIKAQRNIFKMLLYISFFPQLIAGPIVRYKDIEKQLSYRTYSINGMAEGLRLFIFGLGAKLILANQMGLVADTVFSYNSDSLFPLLCWIGAVAYTMQIYFDFSGYSNMAIGMGKIFGFDFPQNFNLPFTAFGVKDFWRRWHISLSTWFREYLYIPLGGNRRGTGRKLLNLMVVFAFTGLWHGASFTFIVWGLLHGMLVCVENIFSIKKLPKAVVHIYTCIFVVLTFVIFRADNMSYGISYLHSMVVWSGNSDVSLAIELLNPFNITIFTASLLAGFGIHIKIGTLASKYMGVEAVQLLKYTFSIVILGLCVITLAASTYNPFIYFRF